MTSGRGNHKETGHCATETISKVKQENDNSEHVFLIHMTKLKSSAFLLAKRLVVAKGNMN